MSTLKKSARSMTRCAICVRLICESSECWLACGHGSGGPEKPASRGLMTGTPLDGSSVMNAAAGALRLAFCTCTCRARHTSSWRANGLRPESCRL